MVLWLMKNYFVLRKFMKINIYPLGFILDSLRWKVTYKKSYDELTLEEKRLSDEFTERLKAMDDVKIL